MGELLEYLPILLKASLLTILLAFCSLAVATFLGALGAKGKLSDEKYGQEYAKAYTYIVRGIPDLLLILIIYFGFQRILNVFTEALGLGIYDLSPFWAGVLAIGFIYGAYLTETFRGAYNAVPLGQKEAAMALGLSPFVRFRKVVLPQLIRHALPGYGNVFQVLIKSTAVVGVLGLNDLVGLAKDAGQSVRMPFTFNAFTLFMYLIFYFFAAWVFRALERRFAEKGHH